MTTLSPDRYGSRRRKRDADEIDREIDRAIELGLPVEKMPSRKCGPALPVKPFRDWIETLFREALARANAEGWYGDVADAKAKSAVCSSLEVSNRSLYRYRFELDEVSEGVVDHATARDGRIHLYDLYPHLAEVVAA